VNQSGQEAHVKKAILYIHGKGGNAAEAERYKPICRGCDVFGMDYRSETPWEAEAEFPRLFDELCGGYASVTVLANSIGAFFTMSGLRDRRIEKALFISPIVNMEKLISDMMVWAGVTEEELRRRKEIPTDFGEMLSWEYLCYVRKRPLVWNVPTSILYGAKDHLTSFETVSGFAERTGAGLTVMEDGGHWFHTDEELTFLDGWLSGLI